jgi:hypothetical protein
MAGIYTIGPGADSFATIQQAAGALSARGMAGDVEFPIAQFVYTGPVRLHSVAGSVQFQTRFYPSGTGAIVDAAGAPYCFAVESTDNVTVQGLRFRGCRDSGSAFVRFVASDQGRLRSCRMEDSAQFGVQVLACDSFRAESLRIEGNLLGMESRGLDFEDCRFAFATRCSIQGRVGSGLWIQGGSDNGNYLVSAVNTLNHGLHIENSSRARIHNFRARGSPQYAGYVINSPYARLDSCVFADAARSAAYFERCDSLWFNMAMAIGFAEQAVAVVNSPVTTVMALSVMGSPVCGLLIRGSPECHVESTQYAGFAADTCIGIAVDSSDCAMFTYTQMTGRVKRGINIRRSADVKFRHTRLTLTAVEAGLHLEQADRASFEPCSLRLVGTAAAVLVADSSRADSFQRLTIVGTPRVGVLAQGARDMVIANSFITGWSEDGVRLEAGSGAVLCHNSLLGQTGGEGAAVSASNTSGVQSRDNILVNRGADSSACWRIRGSWPFVAGGSNYNDLYVAGSGYAARVNDTLCRTLAEWQTLPFAPDLASIALDPVFVSDTDCHITVGSPCRGAGVPVPGFEYDIDLDLRDLVAPDIGADEFRPPSVAEVSFPGPARLTFQPSVVRAISKLDISSSGIELRNACGRRLAVSGQVAPGVYYIRTSGTRAREALFRRVVVVR